MYTLKSGLKQALTLAAGSQDCLSWGHLALGSLLTRKKLAVCIHSCFLKFASERSVS